MKNCLSAIIFILFIAHFNTFAQENKIKFSISPSGILPTGLLGVGHTFGLSFELRGEYPLSENFNAFGSIGYGTLMKKEDNYRTSNPPVPIFPLIIAGVDWTKDKFHIGIGIGYSNFKMSDSFNDNYGGMTLKPHFGYELSKKVILQLNYSNTSSFLNLNYFGLSPIYKF